MVFLRKQAVFAGPSAFPVKKFLKGVARKMHPAILPALSSGEHGEGKTKNTVTCSQTIRELKSALGRLVESAWVREGADRA